MNAGRSHMNPRRASLIAAIAGLLFVGVAPMAAANDLIVKYDQSQLLKLPRAATEIIIGNPTIADVSVQGGNMLVVTGKSFGITNIIALDSDRNVIQDQRILVQRDEVKVVNVRKGIKRESYNCSPQCNPMVTVGDDSQYFDMVAKASQQKIKMSESQADAGNGGAQQ